MYRYDEFDATFVRQRVAQFREQVARRLEGGLSEDEFKPLRLMNGLYLQLHAYMLRVAIPYGTLSSKQMHKLADISVRYDKGYGHFTTRQNIQYNWPELKDVPDLLDELADVEMHAIQTSGNCIRNVTADHFAGVAVGEVEDPRPVAELIRQWSSLHPEFTFLPRKFKIAVIGTREDRAVMKSHDIGLRIVRNDMGDTGFEVHVGGGLGRTPMVAKLIREFLPRHDLLNYLEAIIRVYNLIGRRDNKYKARIKILLHSPGWWKRNLSSFSARMMPSARLKSSASPPIFRTPLLKTLVLIWAYLMTNANNTRNSICGSKVLLANISSVAIRLLLSRSSPSVAFQAMLALNRCTLLPRWRKNTL